MQVSFENGWFLCRDAFTHKDQLRNDGFLYFDKYSTQCKGPAWGTRLWREAAPYKDYFDEKARQIFDAHTVKKCEPNFNALVQHFGDTWSKLDPAQRDGVKFALTRNHSYLAFEAGVGKTATFIVADWFHSYDSKDGGPSLLIVPPNLISNWLEEYNVWMPDYRIATIESQNQINTFKKTDVDLFICSDALFVEDRVFNFKLLPEAIKERRYQTIGIDEAHRFINFEAQRTKEVFGHEWAHGQGIVHAADKVILLSGSHMKRGPINLFAPVFALAWNLINFMSSTSYGVRYCNGHRRRVGPREVWDFKGSSREGELHKRLYNKFIYQKDLEDAHPELKGKKIERVVMLDGGKTKAATLLENTILKKRSIQSLTGSKQVGEIAKFREEIARGKLKPALEYMKTQTDDFETPCAIFVLHHYSIDMLLKALKKYRPLEISGRIKKEDRVKAEKLFQAGKRNIIIWQVKTAIGRNAQRGQRAFFFESPWEPDDVDQPVNRFYRRGQKNIVVADHLVVAKSLDEYVLRTCLDKRETINKVRKGYL